jgi:hypothetical protein
MVAWIIARTDLNRPCWFTVYLGEFTYSTEICEAMRFSREQDAVDMIDSKFFEDAQVEAQEQLFLCA